VHSYKHIDFFRHALALDECRVKFLPEYIHRAGLEAQESINGNREGHEGDLASEHPMARKGEGEEKDQAKKQPQVKEVWFAGSHSDMCVIKLHG
jgi:hypothetical protein